MRCLLTTLILLLCSNNLFSQIKPSAEKKTIQVEKHGYAYEDHYSWLEKMKSDETLNWVYLQNLKSDSILKITKKEYNVAYKTKEYDHLSTNAMPTKSGDYFYSRYIIDKKTPPSLFYRKHLNDDVVEIVNPYEITKNINAYITQYYPSQNNQFLAYELSIDGSDRHIIRFKEFRKERDLTDVLTDVKFSNVVWNQNQGIFYKKNSNANATARDTTNQLFYHRLNTPQSKDQLIFDTTETDDFFTFFARKDTLFIIEQMKNNGFKNYYYCPLKDVGESFKLNKFIENEKTNFQMISYYKGKVYFSSNQYNWGDVRSFSIENPTEEKIVIPQIYNHLLLNARFEEPYIICKYKTFDKYSIRIYDENGKFVRTFDAPHHMDVDINFYQPNTKDLFVTFSSYVISDRNFKLNIETGQAKEYYNDFIRPKVMLFPLDYFETKRINYQSRDNKNIPMTIIHKKGIKLDGSNPTLLKAYGGFGVVSGPSYDTGLLYFLEKGGVFAFAEVRGGGEKGDNWHKEGRGRKKINTFNDFIDAAEYLIQEKYTSSAKLAISGGSQGGLLVGVAMTQRPDLFKVAIPIVGLYDMEMFGKYNAGKYWIYEYGDSEDKEDFEKMMEYSPYHNIKEDVNYPTTLIITSENDDRVVASHSYKFAAKLQNRKVQKNQIFLKVEKDAGHSGMVSSYSKSIEETADFYSFLLYHLNQ
uniref:prolyl oligopeptidase family serine peptidase n=1 Tax=Flavobacterium sp. TaxID=239 RepID=UPI0040495AA0